MSILNGKVRVLKGEAVMSYPLYTEKPERAYILIKNKKGKIVRRYFK